MRAGVERSIAAMASASNGDSAVPRSGGKSRPESPSLTDAARLSPISASVVRTSRSMRERSRSGSIGRRFYHKAGT